MIEKIEALKKEWLSDRGNTVVLKEFVTLLQRCLMMILSTHKYSVSDHEAQELMHEVISQVVLRLDSVEKVVGYAHRILHCEFMRMVAERKRRESVPLDDETDHEAKLPSFSERCLGMDAALIEQLKEVILQLPPPHDRIANAYYFEKCSHKELAKELGFPVNQIGERIKRATAMLRKVLKDSFGTLYINMAEVLDVDCDQVIETELDKAGKGKTKRGEGYER